MRLKIIDLSLKNVAISHLGAPLRLIDPNATRNQEMYVVFQTAILRGNGALALHRDHSVVRVWFLI